MIGKLSVKTIECAGCADKLRQKLKKIKGIEEIDVSLLTQRIVFKCSDTDYDRIKNEIKELINKKFKEYTVNECE